MFILLTRFLLLSLVSRNFQVHLRYSFYFFFHIHLFNAICFQYSFLFVSFHFSKRSDFLVDLIVLILTLFVFLSTSPESMAHFFMGKLSFLCLQLPVLFLTM